MLDETVASNTIGWLSIACWIIVYTPQFFENYTLKSGEGLSVYFVVIWILGDLANLFGALLAGLLPTVIMLAIYYSLCDISLLCQIYYYRFTNPVQLVNSTSTINSIGSELESSETTPLFGRRREEKTWWHSLLPYILGNCFVLIVGGVAYAANTRNFHNRPPASVTTIDSVFDWTSQIFGWISAALYTGSRFPQIMKNFSTKCAGLSPVLFFFAIYGNITYMASILVVSQDFTYLKVNAPWLAGSGLTVILDLLVLSQFIYFRGEKAIFISNAE